MDTTEDLITARGTTHGRFIDNATIAQRLRDLFRSAEHWRSMPNEHREALDMIATKVSRILSGQSSFAGHWEDIAGYAKLAEVAPLSYDDRQIAAGSITHTNPHNNVTLTGV